MIDYAAVAASIQDPESFATRFCRTIHNAQATPIPDYEYARPFWQAFRDRVDFAALKTRQMMVSWLCSAGLLWDVWTPIHSDWHVMVMSRAQTLVDDGGENSTAQSLMGKIKYIYDHLPEEVRLPWIEFSFNRIRNLRTGSSIKGFSSSSEAGRGGNFMRGVQDEDAFIPHSDSVYAAVRPGITRGLIKISTPNGKDNNYYRMVSMDNSPFRVVRMGWRQHPERACRACPKPESDDWNDHARDCWYYRTCEALGFDKLRIAREVNMSFDESAGGRVYYGFGQHCVGSVQPIPGEIVWRGWDFGAGGTTSIWFANVVRLHTATGRLYPALRVFDFYESTGEGAKHYREVCWRKWEAMGQPPVRDIGDPWSLTARESAGSWQANLRDASHPYRIDCSPSGCQGVSKESWLDSARNFMALIETQDGSHVSRLLIDDALRVAIAHVGEWAYPTDQDGRIIAREPRHDEHSHAGTSLAYLCHHLDPSTRAPVVYSADAFVVPESMEARAQW